MLKEMHAYNKGLLYYVPEWMERGLPLSSFLKVPFWKRGQRDVLVPMESNPQCVSLFLQAIISSILMVPFWTTGQRVPMVLVESDTQCMTLLDVVREFCSHVQFSDVLKPVRSSSLVSTVASQPIENLKTPNVPKNPDRKQAKSFFTPRPQHFHNIPGVKKWLPNGRHCFTIGDAKFPLPCAWSQRKWKF